MIKAVSSKLPKEAQEFYINRGVERILRCSTSKSINRIILFGSGAKGELTENSDLDFCVVMQNGSDLKNSKKAIFGCQRDPADQTVYDILVIDEDGFKRKAETGGVYEIIKGQLPGPKGPGL